MYSTYPSLAFTDSSKYISADFCEHRINHFVPVNTLGLSKTTSGLLSNCPNGPIRCIPGSLALHVVTNEVIFEPEPRTWNHSEKSSTVSDIFAIPWNPQRNQITDSNLTSLLPDQVTSNHFAHGPPKREKAQHKHYLSLRNMGQTP